MSPRKRVGVSMRKRSTKKGISWQVRWREIVDGNLRQFTKQFKDQTEAVALKNKIAARLGVVREGTAIAADLVKPPGNLDIVIEEFLTERSATSKEGSEHVPTMQYQLMRLMTEYAWTTTAHITEESVREMIKNFRAQDKFSSAAHFLSTIVNFLGWAKKNYQVDIRVFDLTAKPPEPKERTLWTDAQVRTLIDFFRDPPSADDPELAKVIQGTPEHYEKAWRAQVEPTLRSFYACFRLQVLWAPRPKEAGKIPIRDWDPRRRIVTINKKVSKTRVARSFFVDVETAKALTESAGDRGPNELLFVTPNGCRWRTTQQNKLMKRVLERLQIPGTSYCARHFACTRLANQPRLSIKGAMRITGHKTLSEFSRYLHVRDSELEDVANSSHADFLDEDLPGAAALA